MTAVADEQVAHAPTPSPLRLEPAAAFETLRAFLRESSFDEQRICARLGIDSLERFRAIRDGRPHTPPSDALDMLVRLFLDNEPASVADVRAMFGGPAFDAMRSLGLLRDHRADANRLVSNVLLYPTESLFIASDVAGFPDGDDAQWWDLVYAAITSNSRTFMTKMPRTRCAALLDLCSGTGIAAITAASTFADEAWAVDVADRSTQFARFNARLNEVANVTALSGDLFAPVAGLTFDCIVAHPPYVPSREATLAYRDGGADGEDVTRRIIAGLPAYLRPGGVFHCTCTATDRNDAPFEQRLRTMLGDAANEFDIAVVAMNEFNPTEYYVRLAIAGRGTWPEAEEWHRHFTALGVAKMIYVNIAIIRHEHAHEPFTVRRRAGSATGAKEIGRLVRAAEESASPAALERLLDSRPLVLPHVSLDSRHIREDGDWAMQTCMLSTEVPFDVRLPCPPAMISLIGQMDGTRTIRQLYADMATIGTLADDASIERLASYVHMLVAHGLVELDRAEGGLTA